MDALEIVELASGPAIATDDADRVLGWNEPARELLDYPSAFPAAGQSFHGLVAARDVYGNRFDAGRLGFYEMVTLGEAPRSYELEARRPTGEYVRVAVSVVVVLKPDDGRYELVYFLRRILRRRQADEAIERILAEPRRALAALEPRPAREAQPAPRLTGRQREILRLIAQGKATKQIAAALGVSHHTARRHVQNVLERLEAHSKAEAVSRAFKDRLL